MKFYLLHKIIFILFLHGLVSNYVLIQGSSPVFSDLKSYTKALNKILMYYDNNLDTLDINDAFGLCFTKGQLSSLIHIEINQQTFNLNFSLKRSLLKASRALKYYFNKTSNDKRHLKRVLTLFTSSKFPSLQNHTTKFLRKPLDPYGFVNLWPSLDEYVDVSSNSHSMKPSPEQSDACIASLASSPSREISSEFRKCHLDKLCYDILLNGTDFGYSLSHRILLLVLAHSALQCNIFSSTTDDKLLQDLCSKAFQETLYITHNLKPWVTDVYLEYISLCSYMGYKEFLQQEWLNQLLPLQTRAGCMIGNVGYRYDFSTFPQSGNTTKRMKYCEKHMTAVSAATFSAGIKYILENYVDFGKRK